MSDSAFHVEVVPRREVVRVCPIGEIDLGTVGVLRARLEELRRAGFERLMLDLRGSSFIDSCGLSLVVEMHSASTRDGTDLALIAGPPAVQRAFEVTGLADRLPYVDARSQQNGAAWR